MGLYIRVKYGNFELILYLSVLCCSVCSYQLIHSRTRICNEIVGKRGTARRKKMECSIGDWRKESSIICYVLLSVKKGNEGRTRESIRVWGFKPSQAGAKFKKETETANNETKE